MGQPPGTGPRFLDLSGFFWERDAVFAIIQATANGRKHRSGCNHHAERDDYTGRRLAAPGPGSTWMLAKASIFLAFELPNATTWFYFSGLLAIALFFKFSRLLCIRNWDVLTMFLLMPGLLLLIEAAGDNRWGYVWLLAGSGYFLVRCLLDLILVRRPALSPNLNLAGLVWLACTLFVSHIAVAAREPVQADNKGEKPVAGGEDVVPRLMTNLVQRTSGHEMDVGLWVERGLALACHLSIVIGLVLIGYRHFEDVHAGMAAATFYLLLPYTYLMTPGSGLGRWDHAWPMAWMIWAIFVYRRPVLAGLFLGLATGMVFFPVIVLPVWLSFYWRRGAGRFFLAWALGIGLCLAILAVALPHGFLSSWMLANWQPWKAVPAQVQGLWTDIHWAYRIPVFLLGMVFVITTLVWPMPKNLAHVIALSAASLISIQFWYADQGGIYVLWYLPLLLLLMFRPNLSDLPAFAASRGLAGSPGQGQFARLRARCCADRNRCGRLSERSFAAGTLSLQSSPVYPGQLTRRSDHGAWAPSFSGLCRRGAAHHRAGGAGLPPAKADARVSRGARRHALSQRPDAPARPQTRRP